MPRAALILACLIGPGLAATSHAALLTFTTTMTGTNENSPNPSPATGEATVVYDPVANTLRVIAEFRDLTGLTTAAHIHCCVDPPGNITIATPVPSFALFPLGVTFGSHDETLDLGSATSFSPAFLTAAGGTVEAAAATLIAGLSAGRAYYNIHTNVYPPGEIRGFFTPLAVPEPTLLLLVGSALLAAAARRRRPHGRHTPHQPGTGPRHPPRG